MAGCKYCQNNELFGENRDLSIYKLGQKSFLRYGSTYVGMDSFDLEEQIDFCPKCGANLIGIYDMRWLLKEINENDKKFDFIYFWRNKNETNEINKTCFSQWYKSWFTVGEKSYINAEQYMMSEKAKLFGDEEIYDKIMKNLSPKEIKQLGREVKNFDPDIWEDECRKIVVKGNVAKFSQNPKLKEFLINTGDAILVEASPFDSIWGIGLAEEDPLISNPNDWKGKNYLGFALMTARDIILGKQNIENIF